MQSHSKFFVSDINDDNKVLLQRTYDYYSETMSSLESVSSVLERLLPVLCVLIGLNNYKSRGFSLLVECFYYCLKEE